jgi:hypothetical protein
MHVLFLIGGRINVIQKHEIAAYTGDEFDQHYEIVKPPFWIFTPENQHKHHRVEKVDDETGQEKHYGNQQDGYECQDNHFADLDARRRKGSEKIGKFLLFGMVGCAHFEEGQGLYHYGSYDSNGDNGKNSEKTGETV